MTRRSSASVQLRRLTSPCGWRGIRRAGGNAAVSDERVSARRHHLNLPRAQSARGICDGENDGHRLAMARDNLRLRQGRFHGRSVSRTGDWASATLHPSPQQSAKARLLEVMIARGRFISGRSVRTTKDVQSVRDQPLSGRSKYKFNARRNTPSSFGMIICSTASSRVSRKIPFTLR